jgi:membrane protein YqaA with SNARE-associated domain
MYSANDDNQEVRSATRGASGGADGAVLSRTERSIVALDRLADRPLFLPAVSIFTVLDYVLPFLPNQMLLVSLAIPRPSRWWRLALVFALATGLGACLIAVVIQHFGDGLLDLVFEGRPEGSSVETVLASIRSHGLLALAVLAMLPWPPRVTVIVCALAGLPPLAMGFAVACGRLIPAAGYAALGAFAPQILRRPQRVDAVLKTVEARRRAEGRLAPIRKTGAPA